MPLWPIPFWPRILFLVVLLVLVALGELLIRGKAATRWKEYAFLLFALFAGALYGIVVDQVTSRISPEYFLYAKSLDPDDFTWAVIDLGAKAGLTGGAAAGCILLFANSRQSRKTTPALAVLFSSLRYPLVASAAAAIILGAVFRFVVPDRFLGLFLDLLADNELPGFRTVVGAHYGLYIGGIIGTVIAVAKRRRH